MTQVVNLNQKVLKVPSKFRILMLVGSITFIVVGVLLILLAQSDNYWQVGIVFIVFAILLLLVFIISSLWKVEIKEDGFIYRNCFGRRKSYNFADLELKEYPRLAEWVFIKDGKKVISLESIIKDNEALKDAYYKFLKKSKIKTEENND